MIPVLKLTGFIKSTDHRPNSHRPTDHRLLTHRPTDPMILFERLSNRKIFILQNTHTAENIISVYYLLHLMNNICLHSFECLQKKTWLLLKYIGGINEVCFLGFKLYCFTPPQLFQRYFLFMEISIRPDAFFT